MVSVRMKGYLVFGTFVVCLGTVVVLHVLLAWTPWEGTSVARSVVAWPFLPCALSLLLGAVSVFDMLVVQKQQDREVAAAAARVAQAEARHRAEHATLEGELAARTTAVEVLNAVIARERDQFAETKQLASRLCVLVRDAFQCACRCDAVRVATQQRGAELDAMVLEAITRGPLEASEGPEGDDEAVCARGVSDKDDEDEDDEDEEDENSSVLERCELQTKIQQNEQEVRDLESELQALFAKYVGPDGKVRVGSCEGDDDDDSEEDEDEERDKDDEQQEEDQEGNVKETLVVDTSESAIAEDVGRRGDRSETLGALEKNLERVSRALRGEWARRRALTACVVLVLRQNRVLKRGAALRAAQVGALARVKAATEGALQRRLLDESSSRELLESRMRRHLTDSEVQVQLLREAVLRKTASVVALEGRVGELRDAAEQAHAAAAAAQEGQRAAEARGAGLGLQVLTLQKGLRDLEKVLTEKEAALLCSDDQNRALARTASSQAQDIVDLRGRTFRLERALLAAGAAQKDVRAQKDALAQQLSAAQEAVAQERATAHGLAQRVAALQDALAAADRRAADEDAARRQELLDAAAALHRETTRCEELQRELDVAKAFNEQLARAHRSAPTPRESACSCCCSSSQGGGDIGNDGSDENSGNDGSDNEGSTAVDNTASQDGAGPGSCACACAHTSAGAESESAGPSNDDDDESASVRKKGLGSPCASGVSGSMTSASSGRA